MDVSVEHHGAARDFRCDARASQADIRDQFLSAITPHYKLMPEARDYEARWGGVITRENLRALGEAIIAAAPDDQKSGYGDPLTEGFNSLNVSMEKVKEALNTPFFERRHLLAIGKTEWDSLRWSDHTIADKRSVINEADLVFTAAQSPAAYEAARKSLSGANVNDLLLDCSDAHWLLASPVVHIDDLADWICGNPSSVATSAAPDPTPTPDSVGKAAAAARVPADSTRSRPRAQTTVPDEVANRIADAAMAKIKARPPRA